MGLAENLGVRWTLGDVSERGYEALRLSLWGAWKVFGPEAAYAVCVNSIPVDEAKAHTGEVPPAVEWHESTGEIPDFLKGFLDETMAEGVGWKFAPLRFFPDLYELSLDNDCILWAMPPAIRAWLEERDPVRCVTAEDVAAYFGQFTPWCGPEPRNGGIRGLPPGDSFEESLRELLSENPVTMTSELDEQGLQAAALSRKAPPYVVTLEDVTICSPFYPHLAHLGRCGAHFVGLNMRTIPWDYYDRPAIECEIEHWQRHRPALYANVSLPVPATSLLEERACA